MLRKAPSAFRINLLVAQQPLQTAPLLSPCLDQCNNTHVGAGTFRIPQIQVCCYLGRASPHVYSNVRDQISASLIQVYRSSGSMLLMLGWVPASSKQTVERGSCGYVFSVRMNTCTAGQQPSNAGPVARFSSVQRPQSMPAQLPGYPGSLGCSSMGL